MYTKSVDVYTVEDFMENGKVAYESWGAHYMGAEQNKNLIAELAIILLQRFTELLLMVLRQGIYLLR